MVGEEHVSMIPAPEGKRWAATVNGRPFEVLAPSNAVLLDVLRDKSAHSVSSVDATLEPVGAARS